MTWGAEGSGRGRRGVESVLTGCPDGLQRLRRPSVRTAARVSAGPFSAGPLPVARSRRGPRSVVGWFHEHAGCTFSGGFANGPRASLQTDFTGLCECALRYHPYTRSRCPSCVAKIPPVSFLDLHGCCPTTTEGRAVAATESVRGGGGTPRLRVMCICAATKVVLSAWTETSSQVVLAVGRVECPLSRGRGFTRGSGGFACSRAARRLQVT